jgi:hypothetical protein
MLVGDALARLFSIWTIANNPLTADRAADAGALARKACGVRNRSLRGLLLWVGRQRGGWCPLGRHRRGLARGGSGGTEGRRRWNLGKNFLVCVPDLRRPAEFRGPCGDYLLGILAISLPSQGASDTNANRDQETNERSQGRCLKGSSDSSARIGLYLTMLHPAF